ncbi:unnamed protein product [Lactuca saligna]|uniref:Uncharacterized protein n=1 Tax=Lactuca saligna TaxID=75948 RepID=A0AA35W0S3_LACSI|nr:unnamed protein product [Lactuca saligna]
MEETKKSKRGKKDDDGSFEKTVKETKPKKSPKTKPKKIVQQDVSIAVTESVHSPTVEETQEKETIPSKTRVFHRFKMKSRKSSPQVVRKPQHTHQGVLFREVPAPVFPSSKKRRAEDVAKQLTQKKKKKSRKLIIATTSIEDEERIPKTSEDDLVKQGSIPEDISVIPPEVSHVKSSHEATQTSDITLDVSNMDTNVNMGEEGTKTAAQGTPNVTSDILVSLPSVTSTTDSPTFHNIINTHFTSIFSLQSTDPPKPTSPVDDTMMLENETDNEVQNFEYEVECYHSISS